MGKKVKHVDTYTYAVVDNLKGDIILIFNEISDNRAIVNAVQSIGRMIPIKETSLHKIAKFNDEEWTFENIEDTYIEYESLSKEDKATEMTEEEKEKAEKGV